VGTSTPPTVSFVSYEVFNLRRKLSVRGVRITLLRALLRGPAGKSRCEYSRPLEVHGLVETVLAERYLNMDEMGMNIMRYLVKVTKAETR
jgi:hypothetical protein